MPKPDTRPDAPQGVVLPDLTANVCPGCGASGTLTWAWRLIARPFTAQALAGTQIKTVARSTPVAECPCGFAKAAQWTD